MRFKPFHTELNLIFWLFKKLSSCEKNKKNSKLQLNMTRIFNHSIERYNIYKNQSKINEKIK